NLENVQGDERDIIIMSVCYGHDANGRMLMNFGPINQRGGEKRLNVIFSRARNHMALVSSIRHHDITNDYNDGANSLKHFLQYAEAVSRGDAVQARRVLENLNPVSRKALAPPAPGDAVVDQLARALRDRGYKVEISVGQSRFRCDLAVRASNDELHRLGILVDTEAHYANPNLFDRYLMQPSILRAFGWSFALVLTKDWYHNPDDVLARLEKVLEGAESDEESIEDDQPPDPPMPVPEIQKAEAASPPQAVTAGARYFEFIGGSSRKYWEISESELAFTVRFGRIGTPGQSQTRTFADHEQMKREADRLINEKVKKGYEEKSGASS
ncbi:MAG TPA: WGR domain-containing protein, partial [Terriglobia bacterium]|nr:WGR domain-containing protein [Terriglobia bacterium]